MKGYTNPTIRSTAGGEIVGPKMHSAVKLADSHAWQSMNELAKVVGPNGFTTVRIRHYQAMQRKGLICYPDEYHEEANPHGGRGNLRDRERAKISFRT